jgi:hypothetical protein
MSCGCRWALIGFTVERDTGLVPHPLTVTLSAMATTSISVPGVVAACLARAL